MKFIKAPITECLHSMTEQVDSIRKWGHTWFLDEDGQVDRVRTSTGVLLSVGDKVTDFWGDPCYIESFNPEDDSAYLINEEGGENTDYSIEDIVEMIKKSIRKNKKTTVSEDKKPLKEFATDEDRLYIKIKEEDLRNLPDWPDDMHWYASRYNVAFEKIPDTPFYKVIADNRKDIGRFVHDFDLDDKVLVGNFLESINKKELKEESKEAAVYKITVKEKDAQDLFSSFMVRANSEEEAKQLYQDKYAEYGELVGIRDVSDYEVGEFKRRGMKLYEDVEEGEEIPEPPVIGAESAAASIINSLIRDEWVAIEQYNSAMTNFKEMEVSDKIIEVLNHIMIDENTHVGNLQEVLALLAPATDKIEKGNEQAEEILGTENNEVGV